MSLARQPGGTAVEHVQQVEVVQAYEKDLDDLLLNASG
jgi:hypothetical protein